MRRMEIEVGKTYEDDHGMRRVVIAIGLQYRPIGSRSAQRGVLYRNKFGAECRCFLAQFAAWATGEVTTA